MYNVSFYLLYAVFALDTYSGMRSRPQELCLLQKIISYVARTENP